MPAAQAFLATLTIAGIGFPGTIRIAARMVRRAVDERAVRAFIHARQHFLKRDTVFLSVLVYSGCSASRFPSARSD
jgi:hypothetical protein